MERFPDLSWLNRSVVVEDEEQPCAYPGCDRTAAYGKRLCSVHDVMTWGPAEMVDNL